MRTLVCGGSWNTKRGLVFDVLDWVADETDISRLIVPLQHGIDRWVTQWGNRNRIPVTAVGIPRAEPGVPGRGYERRNARLMQYHPQCVISIGRGEGATRIVRLAESLGLPVFTWDDKLQGGTWNAAGLALLDAPDF